MIMDIFLSVSKRKSKEDPNFVEETSYRYNEDKNIKEIIISRTRK